MAVLTSSPPGAGLPWILGKLAQAQDDSDERTDPYARFNPDTVIDKGTFVDPVQFPEGIEHVFVNGRAWWIATSTAPGRSARLCGNKDSNTSLNRGRRQHYRIIIPFAVAPFQSFAVCIKAPKTLVYPTRPHDLAYGCIAMRRTQQSRGGLHPK
jgi:hypothetical protein